MVGPSDFLAEHDPFSGPLPVSERTQPLVRLAGQVRGLIDVVVRTGADVADIEAATERIAEVNRLLGGDLRAGFPNPSFEEVRRHTRLHNPVSGDGNPLAFPLRLAPQGDGTVAGTVQFMPAHEGPIGWVHGGWTACVLDQVCGHAALVGGSPGMTVSLAIRYRRPTPYGRPLRVVGRWLEQRGRAAITVGEIYDGTGDDARVCVSAEGAFVQPDQSRMAEIFRALADQGSVPPDIASDAHGAAPEQQPEGGS